MSENHLDHINYALVEGVRPPMYKVMKYHGKKPHNIWSDYINTYCPVDGVVLDPFMGSGITAFESIILGRKAITFDLNPLSTFLVEVMTQRFDSKKFSSAVDRISQTILNDNVYKHHYTRTIKNQHVTIYNYIWENGSVSKFAAKSNAKHPVISKASEIDAKLQTEMADMTIPYWFPNDNLPAHPSINQKFLDGIGGNNISYLWTKRNLYLLAKIFDSILNEEKPLVKPLLLAFMHTVHLVCKMVVPRTERGGRPFSGSWGRADYMIRNRQMEQNPLEIFKRSCIDKQGVVKALTDASKRLSMEGKIINEVSSSRKKLKNNAILNYGIIDIADLHEYVPDSSIDFILTDPPYGGLVQYLDLSLVWLSWLKHYDQKYEPCFTAEITVKKNIVSREEYKRKLTNAFRKLHNALKPDGYLVTTFHNQHMQEWNDFIIAMRDAGFKFDHMTHQYNKRSGESNVSNPYGTTGSDFYIRWTKQPLDRSDGGSDLSLFVLNKTIQLLGERGEKTPFSFIINRVLPEMVKAGYFRPDEPTHEIRAILNKYVGDSKPFHTTENDNGAGDYWWFNNPKEFISHPDLPLTDRVRETVLSVLRRRISVKLDDVIAELFKQYRNGLTPDPKSIVTILKKIARKEGAKWKIREEILGETTKHSEIIAKLCKIGSNAHFQIFVGKREQPEKLSNGMILRNLCNLENLQHLQPSIEPERIKRIEMIDVVWLTKEGIGCIFEVENSTNFTMGIQRGSNVDRSIPKIMIIPDDRLEKLTDVADPLFRQSFINENWRYLTYTEVDRISRSRNLSLNYVFNHSHPLYGLLL